jgi:hypothetical protein
MPMNQAITNYMKVAKISFLIILFVVTLIIILKFDPGNIYNVFQLNPINRNIGFTNGVGLCSSASGCKLVEVISGFASMQNILVISLNYLILMGVGYKLLYPTFTNIKISLILKLIGSFWAGYLINIAIYRICTILFEVHIASFVTLFLECIVILGLIKNTPTNMNLSLDFRSITKLLIFLLLVILAIFVLFIYQIFNGDFRFVGHGTYQYIFLVKTLFNDIQYIPLIPSHQDELLFATFFYNFLQPDFDIILVSSLTLATMKVSILVFIFLVFKKFNMSNLYGCISILYIAIGSFYLNPSKYMIYYDSNNPLLFTVHAGRIIAFPFFIFLGLMFFKLIPFKNNFIAFILLSLGYSLTPISNSIIVIVYTLCILLFSVWHFNVTRLKFILSIGPVILVFLSFLAICITYEINTFNTRYSALIAFIPVILLFIYLLKFNYDFSLKRFDPIIILCLWICVVIGNIFLGNIFVDNYISRSFYGFLNISDNLFGLSFDNLLNSGSFPNRFISANNFWDILFKSNLESGAWVQYNTSGLNFFYHYVLIFFLSIIPYLIYRKQKVSRFNSFYLFLLIFSSLLVFSLFFYIDFVADMNRSWLKSRMLEIPIFIIVFLVSVMTFKEKVNRIGVVLALFFISWSILPFFSTNRIPQLFTNLKYFLQLLGL